VFLSEQIISDRGVFEGYEDLGILWSFYLIVVVVIAALFFLFPVSGLFQIVSSIPGDKPLSIIVSRRAERVFVALLANGCPLCCSQVEEEAVRLLDESCEVNNPGRRIPVAVAKP